MVLEKDIKEISPKEVSKYQEVHWFAGIGGFSLGLHWARWSLPIWTGGFPCQDISCAGTGEGLSGKRSGLWWEWLRLIKACRPVRLLIENSPILRSRGADEVLDSLEEIGYTCWPIVVGAVHVGAPIKRSRSFTVAVTDKIVGKTRVRFSKHLQGGEKGVPKTVGQRFDVNKWGLDSAPRISRMDARIPARVDRLEQLGNSVCPHVVKAIAEAWLKAENHV